MTHVYDLDRSELTQLPCLAYRESIVRVLFGLMDEPAAVARPW